MNKRKQNIPHMILRLGSDEGVCNFLATSYQEKFAILLLIVVSTPKHSALYVIKCRGKVMR